MKSTTALILSFLVWPVLSAPTQAQSAPPAIAEAEARAIGVDAYLYFYPLLSTDITRLTSTNIEAGKEPLKGPMNTFVSAAAYPPGDLKLVVLALLAFGGGFGSCSGGCAVLRTASANISYSSALVLFGLRVDFHEVVYWVTQQHVGMRQGDLNPVRR
jgi:hypothetical protein